MLKKITQQDLRKAMSEHKKKLTVKKIESPLARYNELGQLLCVLCKSIVRSETVWPVHLNSKTHKENIALVKQTKLKQDQPVSQPAKRPNSSFVEPIPVKKYKGILKISSSVKSNNLPEDFFDKPSPTSAKSNINVTSTPATIKQTPDSFVGQTISEIQTLDKKVKEKDRTKDTPIPEGFFDDPIQDAKARNVEYKNPIEEELERFQKEIEEVNAQSAQIIADDQEEATTDRQLDEIDDQILYLSRVVDLEKKKEKVQPAARKEGAANSDDTSSGDDDIYEFDWRAQSAHVNKKHN